MEKKQKEQQIKQILFTLGADVCGIGAIDRFQKAPKGFSPLDLYEGCKSVIAIGVALPKGIMAVEPRCIYAHFNDPILTAKVDEIAVLGAKEIEKQFGGLAIPIPCDAPNDYWEPENLTAKGLISMKHTAVLCGIGQLGKNSLLLHPTFGNLLTIGVILTDLELESDALCENICIEGCNQCIASCPVQAIEEGRVNQKLCRPNAYGKTARGFGTVECHQCRNVCPMKFGKKG